jgi:hypothetical protein
MFNFSSTKTKKTASRVVVAILAIAMLISALLPLIY